MRQAVEPLESRRLCSAGFVADLSPAGVYPTNFLPWAGGTAFSATTPQHGTELWTTNGTAAGTRELFDLFPGTTGSTPKPVAAVGNLLLFTAESAPGKAGLWSTDGTLANTKLICPTVTAFSLDNAFGEFTQFGNRVAFVQHNSLTGLSDLFATDGVTITRLRTSIESQMDGTIDLSADSSHLYFWAGYNQFRTLYRTDSRLRTVEVARGTYLGGGVGAGLGSEFVTPVIDGRTFIYAFPREAGVKAKALGNFYAAKVLGTSGSAVYIAAQMQDGQPFQIYRYDGRSLTAVSKFTSGGFTRRAKARLTVEGLYFSDGGPSLYFVGNTARRVAQLNTLPADSRGRTGSIEDFKIARDGSIFVRRTLGNGEMLLLAKGQFRRLGEADLSTPFAVSGNSAVYSRRDPTGLNEAYTARTTWTAAAQLSDLQGGASDSGIRALTHFGDGVVALAVQDIGPGTARNQTHSIVTIAHRVFADGRAVQLGSVQTVARYQTDSPQVFSAGSAVFFTAPRVAGSGSSADLYRSDGTSGSAILIASDVGLSPKLIGVAGAYAFFQTGPARILTVPLRGRPQAFPLNAPAALTDMTAASGRFVFVRCANGQVLSLDGQLASADVLTLNWLPGGSQIDGIQIRDNQLLLLTRQGTTATLYQWNPETGARITLASYANVPAGATAEQPIVGPNPDEVWTIYNSAGDAHLVRFDTIAGTAVETDAWVVPLHFFKAATGGTTGRLPGQIVLAYDGEVFSTRDGTGQTSQSLSTNPATAVLGQDAVYSIDSSGALLRDDGVRETVLANKNQVQSLGVFSNDRLWFVGRDLTHGREIWSAQYAVGSIHGRVFDDTNHNGAQDNGEAGQSGMRVWVDLNGNGVVNRSVDLLQFTDANGGYQFDELPIGTYVMGVLSYEVPTSTPNAYRVKLTRGAAVARHFGLILS